ncbi:MAG: ATP-binding protein [Phycisphaerae bacterium]|jgi:serine/threonine-protein kinase RsbW|nr:ATP-binding protein [Phycisphaerae bacterium]
MTVPPEFGIRESDLTEMVVPSNLRSAKEPERRIVRAMVRNGYDPETTFGLKLALEEAMTNAVKHGNCNDPSKSVVVRYYVDPRRVVVMVRDEGCGFCPENVPDPTAEENLERPNGRGIMLMHSYTTRVCYNRTGNEVWMLKEKSPPPQPTR